GGWGRGEGGGRGGGTGGRALGQQAAPGVHVQRKQRALLRRENVERRAGTRVDLDEPERVMVDEEVHAVEAGKGYRGGSALGRHGQHCRGRGRNRGRRDGAAVAERLPRSRG